MNKVLIIAYDFPPYVSVGGLRPYSWFKYLNEFDFYPIVVTRQWANKYGNNLDYISPSEKNHTIIEETKEGKIIRTPYNPNIANKLLLKYGEKKFILLRKFISLYFEVFQWVFNIGPKKELYKEAKKQLRNNKFDIIIATGDPFILFKYASKLSKKHNIPWIADYRDPWVEDISVTKNRLFKKYHGFLEKKYASKASRITAVSSFVAKCIQKNIPNAKIDLLINGYNDLAFEKINSYNQNFDTLTVSLAGSIKSFHPIYSFLEVLVKLKKIGIEVNLNLYGINIVEEITDSINNKYKELNNNITIVPKLQNEDLIKELAKSNLLLLFNNYASIATKIYDYIALNRKILFCFTNEKEAISLKESNYKIRNDSEYEQKPQEKLLKKTNTGIIVEDKNQLYDILIQLDKELKKNKSIKCDSVNIEKYSRKYQTGVLANIFNDLILK